MAASEVDIDDLRESYQQQQQLADHGYAPYEQYAAPPSSGHTSNSMSDHNSNSVGSGGSFGAFDQTKGSSYSLEGGDSEDYSRVQQASSFNVEEMINMRESSGAYLRDSLMPPQPSAQYPRSGSGSVNERPGFVPLPPNSRDSIASGGRFTEMGNPLMRMDDGYRRTSSNIRLSSAGTTPDGLTPLLQAARAGDLVLVNALVIQAGTDILRRDPMFGQTALHFAIRGGHLGVVQALLMPQLRGSIVNVADNRRNTALHLAAAKSRRMTKLLLECGADVNFLNMRNQTPLGVHILTVTRDDPTLTEILLQHRANPNAPVDKSTILHVALDKGLVQIATRLVRYGARLDAKDEAGKTVFDKVDAPTLKLLLSKVRHAPVWIPDDSRTACMECSKTFGLGARRHHCRFCGRVMCSACTNCHVRMSKLPFSVRKKGKKNAKVEKGHSKARVCTTCFEICGDGRALAATENNGPEMDFVRHP
jgi:hypothetical protein